ncbi:calcium channel flower isoform X1 [Hydra vulgaris]|uniref:calcium channel flower isoform X1 n=1 Tax=Hydra vulgaris TaxID=6087 RepID=UPI0002B44FE0|nr:calcium channel flower [Hydra vulgaris]
MAGENQQRSENAPKTLRFLVRIYGLVAAFILVSAGLFVLLTISGKCVIAGILQISIGVLVLALEVPLCCSYIECLVQVSNWVESHFRFWMRGLLYLAGALPSIFLCLELSTIIGSGSLLLLASLYGLLFIGKKGADKDKPFTKKDRSNDIEVKSLLKPKDKESVDLNTY